MSLLDALVNEGLNVRPYPGWETRTNLGRDRAETVGIVNHWDAIRGSPNNHYYINGNRFGALIYHILVRRDSTIDLFSQRYVYHAGQGDDRVLQALRAGRVPAPPHANDRSGNPYMLGIAVNYHPQEGDMGEAQYNSLVKVNRAVISYYDLSVNQIIDHRGWTDRKSDINTMSLGAFRTAVAGGGGSDPGNGDDEEVKELIKAHQRALNHAGFKGANGKDLTIDGVLGPNTEFALEAQAVAATKGGGSGKDLVARNEADRAHVRLDGLRNI